MASFHSSSASQPSSTATATIVMWCSTRESSRSFWIGSRRSRDLPRSGAELPGNKTDRPTTDRPSVRLPLLPCAPSSFSPLFDQRLCQCLCASSGTLPYKRASRRIARWRVLRIGDCDFSVPSCRQNSAIENRPADETQADQHFSSSEDCLFDQTARYSIQRSS